MQKWPFVVCILFLYIFNQAFKNGLALLFILPTNKYLLIVYDSFTICKLR